MTPEVQREALRVLSEVWALSPDVRLGQLLAHLGFLGEAHLGRSLGYLEDDEMLAVLYRHRAELLARQEGGVVEVGGAVSVSGSPILPGAVPAIDAGR